MLGVGYELGATRRMLLALGAAVWVVSCGGPGSDADAGAGRGGASENGGAVHRAGNGGTVDSAGSGGTVDSAGSGGTVDSAGSDGAVDNAVSGGDAGAASQGGSTSAVAGAPAEAGAAGADGTAPVQPPLFERVETVPADKMDLLFMIDNSISMADKQKVFEDALPLLVQRLVTPVCVDAAGRSLDIHAGNDGRCARGEPELPPIRDIHIAVITSSLGSHGGDVCASPAGALDQDDKGRLLPSVRAGLESWDSAGFLAWDPEGTRNTPPGEANASTLVTDFTNMVRAVGDSGCGYEASLEAWYRFLVDPDPLASITRNTTTLEVDLTYPDAVLLEQRERFLRPDSLVGIVMLTDENDCSILDEGQGWLVTLREYGGRQYSLPRATSACAVNPNDECCGSCNGQSLPAHCAQPAADPECALGQYTASEDNANLRCHDQKRRFGFDMLYPVTRYVEGLTSAEVRNRDGETVPNPLLVASNGASRDPSRVFLMGVVGVPWQDVADAESLTHPSRLRYLDYAGLVREDRWSLLLGQGTEPPLDGLMFETDLDRSTLGFEPHPLTGDRLQPASSDDPRANAINGHESATAASDLQYACIFPLAAPRDCTSTDGRCDCAATDIPFNRALCQPPGGGPTSTTQYYAKAYPSVRQLAVLKDFGALGGNAVVASICPKVHSSPAPSTDPDYGYNPAVTAMVDRMKGALSPACLAQELATDASGQVACRAMEVTRSATCGACDEPGRQPASPAAREALLSRLETNRYCGAAGQPACDQLCLCEVEQLQGVEGRSCREDGVTDSALAGFCYVDAAQGLGASALVDHCPAERKRRLRFLGETVPQGAVTTTFLLCEG